MKIEKFQLELITPCFCAGADQAKAEIRASSVRGQLRWWFRALGGQRDEEARVFGSVDKDLARSSAIQVRVVQIGRGRDWDPPRVRPESSDAYVYYFASVSGKQKNERWKSTGNVPPGSKFLVNIRWVRNISESDESKLQKAINLWRTIGGLGLRVTRGLGAFSCAEAPLTQEHVAWTRNALCSSGFGFELKSAEFTRWQDAVSEAGRILKYDLRSKMKAGKGGDRPSPLGSSNRPRQTSAVYLRPVKWESENYGLVLFEAPAERVLGHVSRRGGPVLAENGLPASESLG